LSGGVVKNKSTKNFFVISLRIFAINLIIDAYYPFVKVQSLTFADFLSNVGGFMGLLAGISVHSFVEFFYHAMKDIKLNKKRVHCSVDQPMQPEIPKRKHALYELMKYFVKFLKNSDMHGLPYITDKTQSRRGRVFWAVLVLLSFGFCLVMIRDLSELADRSPLATRIDSQIWTQDDVSSSL
jgi:Amiloride-sensitive sodium channel